MHIQLGHILQHRILRQATHFQRPENKQNTSTIGSSGGGNKSTFKPKPLQKLLLWKNKYLWTQLLPQEH